MSTHWKEWEKKVGQIFENIGYTKIEAPERYCSLPERSFCLERLNQVMQVDVFVRVDKYNWILIECRDRRNATIKHWLHEIKGRACDRLAKIKSDLKSKSHKVFGVAATSLKTLDSKTQATADDTGVSLWHHGVVDYLNAITKGARAQVEELVLNRCGKRKSQYPPIKIHVQAWPIDSEPWFVGFVSPLQLAQAAFVYQRGQGFGEAAYQRFLKPKRISEIADFVKNGKRFPNSIVMALPENTALPKAEGKSGLMTLTIPGNPEGIKIIDGQHRFFGAVASGVDPKLLCTFVKCDDLDQATMFAKINGKQISVNKSQLVSLFGIPGFAAKIASGLSASDQKKVDLEEAIYRTLEQMSRKGPLAEKLNFYPGRPAQDMIPFKTLYDAVLSIANQEQSGFKALSGKAQERGKVFGDRLSEFLFAWAALLGKDFYDEAIWFSPTMLSSIIYTYPDCRWKAANLSTEKWLNSQTVGALKPDPQHYRGAGGARKLAKLLCKKIGLTPQFL
jgi:DGQHR domain-containing protein